MDYPDAFTLLRSEIATVRVEPPDVVIVDAGRELRYRRAELRACTAMLVEVYRARHQRDFVGKERDIVVRIDAGEVTLLGPFEWHAGIALGEALDCARGQLVFAQPGFALLIAKDEASLAMVVGRSETSIPMSKLVEMAIRDDDRLAGSIRYDTRLPGIKWLELRQLSGPPGLIGPLGPRDAAIIAFAFRTWRGERPLDREPVPVEERDLIANPTRWHNRRIVVTGEWHNQFEGSRFANAWLQAPGHGRIDSGSYRVRVVGTWIYPDANGEGGYGHLGGSPGVMRAETIDILETRDNSLEGLTRLLKRGALQVRSQPLGPIAFALFDLDHFKRYNDTHGHVEGDELLRRCAKALRDALGADALIARWGGEEFGAVLPIATARQDAERARAAIAAVGITCSGGLAWLRDGEGFGALAERSDAALYAAKRGGRDRLVVDP